MSLRWNIIIIIICLHTDQMFNIPLESNAYMRVYALDSNVVSSNPYNAHMQARYPLLHPWARYV